MKVEPRVNELAIDVTFEGDEVLEFNNIFKHREAFALIMGSGIMDIREGSAEIHFGPDGSIGAIKAHVNVFKRDPRAPIFVIHSPQA